MYNLSENEKGFTIVELIVVIAIISVLAAIVTINVFGYIQEAQNAAIIANINTMMKAGIIYLSENGNYGGFFDDTTYLNAKNAILQIYPDANPIERISESDNNAYCICYGLKGETGKNKHTFCIDSSNYNKEENDNKNCGWRCQTSGVCRNQ